MIENLPEGWAAARLGDIVDVNPRVGRGEIADETTVSFVPMATVGEATGIVSVTEVRSWRDVKRGYTPMRENDVVFAKITPCMENGKVALLRGLHGGFGAGSTELVVLRSRGAVLPSYLLHFLLQERIRRDARAVMQGAAGQLRVPLSFLADLPLPVPPLEEQSRIVAMLEEHLSDLDAAVAGLERVRANLRRYRTAVLQSAVFAEDARGWSSCRVVDVGEVVTGTTPPTAVATNYGGELPFVKPTDLNAGYDVRTAREHLSVEGAKHARILPAGSVLVTCIGATIGKCGIARVPCATNQQINAVIPDKIRILPEYLYMFFASPLGQAAILRNASSTTLPILNKSKFSALGLSVPTLDEQKSIVADVELRLSLAERTMADVNVQLVRAAQLRQSILRRAFAGKLAPQDSAGAPANALAGEHVPLPSLRRARTQRSRTPQL